LTLNFDLTTFISIPRGCIVIRLASYGTARAPPYHDVELVCNWVKCYMLAKIVSKMSNNCFDGSSIKAAAQVSVYH